jgi:hypothetical protein
MTQQDQCLIKRTQKHGPTGPLTQQTDQKEDRTGPIPYQTDPETWPNRTNDSTNWPETWPNRINALSNGPRNMTQQDQWLIKRTTNMAQQEQCLIQRPRHFTEKIKAQCLILNRRDVYRGLGAWFNRSDSLTNRFVPVWNWYTPPLTSGNLITLIDTQHLAPTTLLPCSLH